MGNEIRTRDLKLVDDSAATPRSPRFAVGFLCLLLGSAALLATGLGADRSRSPLDARRHVADTLNLALAEGNGSPAVIDRLRQLRRQLGHRPLDSKSRVRYAALLLAMTRSFSDTRAAAFHARAAAELAPVTFPVVELSTLILARCGDRDEALTLVRSAFEFDPDAAAGLLLQLEDGFPDLQPASAVADSPEAWLAWSRALTENGRDGEAGEALLLAAERWRDDLGLLVALCRRASRAADWDALERRVESVDPIPLEGRALELLAYRARLHAERGRREDAESDLRALLANAADAPHLLILAGDVQRRLGANDLARGTWHRALFRVAGDRAGTRVSILVRLAELEESEGRASVALRHWRSVLALEPDHPRARRRVAELTGFET